MGWLSRNSDPDPGSYENAEKGDGHQVYRPEGGKLDQKADEAILDMLEKPQS